MDSTKRALKRDEIREIDRKAIEEYEIPGIILMENAGRNVLADGDASTNLKILLNMNLKIKELEEVDIEEIGKKLQGCNIIVDAIFGTGLSGEVREPARSLIMKINETNIPVVSVDIPSGLDCDEGVVLGAAVKATKTVTFVAAKAGFF